jgi:Protein of unknown function (DUF4231)
VTPPLALFRRLPRLGPPTSYPLLPADAPARYPALAQDIDVVRQELVAPFDTLDRAALRSQNSFRWQQLALILGSMAATGLGAVHAALPAWWAVGFVEAVLGAGLLALAGLSQRLRAQEEYFTTRQRAELLRSEAFLFLGRVGRYADDHQRVRALRRRVAEIQTGEVQP